MGRVRWWKSIVSLLGVAGVAAGLVVAGAAPAQAATTGSTYVPLAATRILDTRSAGPAIGANATRALTVTGLAGIPTDPTQVTAIVANVTVTGPTSASFLTVYPADQARPGPSNLDFTAGVAVANMVITGVSSTGTIDIYNHVGTVNVVVDVTGYYTPDLVQGTSTFNPVPAAGILDTRNAVGVTTKTPIPATGTLRLQVEGVAGVPESAVSAVVLNVTAVNSTTGGDLTIYPADGSARPSTSDLNFAAHQTIANLVIVPMPNNATSVNIFNGFGSTDVLVTVVGYYTTGLGTTFSPLDAGLLDTRHAGTGGTDRPLVGGTATAQQVTGLAGVPADGTVSAVVLHITITNPSVAGFLTVYPDGTARPSTSNMNAAAGGLVSNTAIVPVGADGEVDFFYQSGTADIVVTVQGYFST
ncbi:MAG TPA: hypothetical protein VFW65_03150 [Pseudonocardiaceae bacterium]|nr:hypothetical protein [Pseudonocardiaceae bacterium]